MRRHRGGRRRPWQLALFSAAVILAVTVFACRLDARLRTVVADIAQNAARDYCINAVNDCVTAALAECGEDFGRLVSLGVGENGVNVLVSDTAAINNLKATLTARIQQSLSRYEPQTVGVAIGTIIGSDLLTDRGPSLPVKVIFLGYVTTELKNEFSEAGINQTVYRIMLSVNTAVSTVLSGYTASADVNTQFCISETVIVGAVPGAYTEVNEAQDKISSIYDFMAGDGTNGIQ